jgi:hypothetical protein
MVTAMAIGLTWTLAVARASVPGCPATATVTGAARITEPVRAILRAHDVSTDAGECAVSAARVHATVVAEPGVRGYVLRIEDPFGRKSERHIGDAETAASLIESWLVPETEGVTAPPPATTRAQAVDETETRAAKDADAGGSWRITGAAEIATNGGESLWYGGSVTACGTVGAWCLGGRLRFARDDSFFDVDHDSGSRSAVEGLALAALPLAARGITLTPMLGFGVGRLHANNPIATDGEVDMPGGDDVGLRLEAAVSAGLSLNRHLTLVGELGGSHAWSIASHTNPGSIPGATMIPPSNYVRAAVALQYAP